MAVVNKSANIFFDASISYDNNTVGKRLVDLASDVISASIPDGSLEAVKLDATDDAAFRIAIGVIIGTDVQAWSALLDEFAALSAAANKGVYFDGSSDLALFDLSAYMRGLLSSASEAALKAAINAEAGVDFQAYHANLAAEAGLTGAADKVSYYTGAGAKALADFPAAGRALAGSGESKDLVATINAQTGTTYTIDVAGSDSDRGRIVRCTNGAGITVTLPATAPVGFYCTVYQGGAGQVGFAAASGATIVNQQSHTKIAGQHGAVGLVVFENSGGSAAQWTLSGDTAA